MMTHAAKLAVLTAGVLAAVAISRPALAAARRVDPEMIAGFVVAINDKEFNNWFRLEDVMAIIEIESSFDPNAYRAEKHLGDASRGLMQILLSTAKDRGFSGDPTLLFDVETNIRYGMRQLKWTWDYLARAGFHDRDKWIGAYNAGVGNALKGYTPLSYVTKFVRARDKWRGLLP